MEDSPFAKLAAELRNQIFLLALSRKRITLTPRPSDRDITWSPSSRRLRLSQEANPGLKYLTALTQTCRQLRAETTGLFYSNNTFAVKTHCHDYPSLVTSFRQIIGASNSSALKSLILQQNLGQGLTSTIPKDKSISERSISAGTHGPISGIEVQYDFNDGTIGTLNSGDDHLATNVSDLTQHCRGLQQKANQEYARGEIEHDECVTRFWCLNTKKQNLRLAEMVLSKSWWLEAGTC